MALPGGSLPVQQEIEEDMRRGHSWWRGEYDPNLPYEPGSITKAEELAAAAEAAVRGKDVSERPFLMGRLPGLCAICVGQSYCEVASKLWEDYVRGGFSRWGIIAIFEGRRAGSDPEGWPLFSPKKLLAIAEVEAIVRAAE